MIATGPEAMLARLQRDTVVSGLAAAAAALALWPDEPRRAAGVVAGLALVAIGYLGIRAGVDAALERGLDAGVGTPEPESLDTRNRRPSGTAGAPGGFVKFFTRHAILAAGAYVMIARFELHPVAMLVGVSMPALAAGIEFVRIVRARGTGSHSRSS